MTPFFLGDVVFSKKRIQDQVGEHVEREREMLVEHLGVVAHHFLGRERIQSAAD